MDELAETGYQGVEGLAVLMKEFKDRTEMAQRHLDERHLALVALDGGGDFANPDRGAALLAAHLPLAEFLQRLHGDRLVVTWESRAVVQSTPLDFRTAAHTLNELGRRCQDFEVCLCLLPQTGQRIESEEEIDRILNLVDTRDVFLALDTAHLAECSAEPVRILETYGECLRHIRFKDRSPENDDPEWPLYCPLGEGEIQFSPLIEALKRIGYQGWIGVDLEEPLPQTTEKECAQRSRDCLEELMKEEPS